MSNNKDKEKVKVISKGKKSSSPIKISPEIIEELQAMSQEKEGKIEKEYMSHRTRLFSFAFVYSRGGLCRQDNRDRKGQGASLTSQYPGLFNQGANSIHRSLKNQVCDGPAEPHFSTPCPADSGGGDGFVSKQR